MRGEKEGKFKNQRKKKKERKEVCLKSKFKKKERDEENNRSGRGGGRLPISGCGFGTILSQAPQTQPKPRRGSLYCRS